MGRLVAHGADQGVDPLVSGETRPPLAVFAEVDAAHLDRLQAGDHEGEGALAVRDAVVVLHQHVAPDAGQEQSLVLLEDRWLDGDVVDVRAQEPGPVDALGQVLVQLDAHEVDQPLGRSFLDPRLDQLRLVAARDVAGDLLLHQAQALAHLVVIEQVGTVFAEHELDHVGGCLAHAPDLAGEVLADHQAGEGAEQQLVERIRLVGAAGDGHCSVLQTITRLCINSRHPSPPGGCSRGPRSPIRLSGRAALSARGCRAEPSSGWR